MEIFEFLIIIWRYLFSKEARQELIKDWKKESKSWKVVMLFELSMSTLANILLFYLVFIIIT